VGMVRNAVRSLLAEPRAPQPPRRVWRDWVLVAALLIAVVLEGVLRPDLVWRPVALVLGVAVVCALLWRRTHPLAVVAAVFGALIVTDIGVLISGSGSFGLYAMICVVLLPYALVRWGSGREIVIGLAIIVVALVLGNVSDFTGYVETVVGSMFLLFPGTLGAAVRYWSTARIRELDQVRLREREQLARELHDTVAHHVSAIVIRAQAGRAVAATRPEAAVDALAVIEAEGSRTLAEMRTMVGVLRDDGTAALVPQPGVADLERLARSVGDRPRVEVEVSGELEDFGPAVGAAIYRIAQESITNAVRHARQATRIDVRVASDGDAVRLTIRDDGEATSAPRNSLGYGLVGMTERAMLLGGSFAAGPGAERGWTVDVVLPRTAAGR
jgi:signal transduction histidine kinase